MNILSSALCPAVCVFNMSNPHIISHVCPYTWSKTPTTNNPDGDTFPLVRTDGACSPRAHRDYSPFLSQNVSELTLQ